MKNKRLFIDYLEDILDSILKIFKFTKGVSEEKFFQDEKTAYAVIRSLEIIGEASKKIPGNIRTKYPKLPWREMAGMRDKLIHDYIGVDLAVVWKTIQEDIPEMEEDIRKIINIEKESENEKGQDDLPKKNNQTNE